MQQVNPIIGKPVTRSLTTSVKSWDGKIVTDTKSVTLEPPKIPPVWVSPFREQVSNLIPPKPDKSSFTKIKKSGEIKMTPYQRGWTKVELPLLTLSRELNHYLYCGVAIHEWANPEGTKWYLFAADVKREVVNCPYDIHLDYNGLLEMFSGIYYDKIDIDSEIDSAVQKCMAGVVSELNSTYDLLTELAEFSSTLELLVSYLDKIRHPLKNYRDAVKKLKKSKLPEVEIHNAAASLWMQYRYGIMPIVMSVKDIIKTMDTMLGVYRTVRKKEQVLGSKPKSLPDDRMVLQDNMSGVVTVRAVGKGRYSVDAGLRLVDLIKFNWITTAWELVPYSFVIDWFLNVGDVLDAQFGGLFSLLQEKKFCYSIKSEFRIETTLYDYDDTRVEIPPVIDGHWKGTPSEFIISKSWPALSYGRLHRSNHVCRVETRRTYIRKTFTPDDISLNFNPDMNWKRWVDAYVLTLGNTRNQLRRLRA